MINWLLKPFVRKAAKKMWASGVGLEAGEEEKPSSDKGDLDEYLRRRRATETDYDKSFWRNDGKEKEEG